MKQIYILYSDIKSKINKDLVVAKNVKDIHTKARVDTIFIPEADNYLLLRKYCNENEIAPIEIYNIPYIERDIITSYFNIIRSNSEEDNLIFIPEFPSDGSKRLENLLEKLYFEVESILVNENKS